MTARRESHRLCLPPELLWLCPPELLWLCPLELL